MPTETNIRLLIADDHEVVRHGIKAMLASTPIKVVAEATTAEGVVRFAEEKDVDVVVMEARFSDGDGLTALGRIKLVKKNLPVILFSDYDNPSWNARAVALDAAAYLLKSATRYNMTVEEYKTKNLMKVEIKSKDIGNMVAAMASPLFAKVTGAQIPVDGGNDRVI